MDADAELLKRLVDAATQIAQGNYDRAQAVLELSNEGSYPPAVATLAEAFGMMLVKVEAREFQLAQKIDELADANQRLAASLEKIKILENLRDLLGKFVPSSVRRRLDENPEAPDLERRERELAVLFLDVAGFTSLTEATSAEKINHLVERYFSSFIDDIFAHHGEICESQGDGLMLIFEADDTPGGHIARAALTALAIRHKVAAVNRSLPAGEPPIRVNIGIDAGRAMLGSTCFEGVAGARWTYTAYGMAVNIAARIGKIASNGQILISSQAANRLPVGFATSVFGEHTLKNVSEPISISELLDACGFPTAPAPLVPA